MLEDAERRGLISPGRTTVLEYTSGNTGVSLAMACACKGYDCIIIMPQLPVSPMIERFIACRKFGAQVHLTAPAAGVPGMRAYMEQLLCEHQDYWCPRQFENEANPSCHFDTTGPEIWSQTCGRVDFLVAGAGTGGTIVGVGRYLKQKNPHCKLIVVEPSESRALVGKQHSKHSIFGIGAGCPLPFIDSLDPTAPYQVNPKPKPEPQTPKTPPHPPQNPEPRTQNRNPHPKTHTPNPTPPTPHPTPPTPHPNSGRATRYHR